MTIIEKLENKIDLTDEELNYIVYYYCPEIEDIITEERWGPHVSTYFRTTNDKWYQLNWKRGTTEELNVFYEQPYEVKREVKKIVKEINVWEPIE
ncbi:hypothetical protein [Lactobacillus taiwanensis]|uniref:hypothetical protein n=1 Tax=Lactobacillus taiwanensis TaxID=508451 RepID=UPI0032200FB0